MSANVPTKSQARKCGEIMRQCRYEPAIFGGPVSIEQFFAAHQVVLDFRRDHQTPMTKVRVGLASMIRTEKMQPIITQRLKRTPRIIRKLQRSVGSPRGRTTLDRLEDIGGVRAILPDQDGVEKIVRRIAKNNWVVHRDRDYVAAPQDSGYWARHLVVKRDGRFVEIQLRTPWEQSWADAVEAADSRLNLTLKDGVGPESMRRYFELAAKQLRARELGDTVDSDTVTAFLEAREQVVLEGYYSK